MSTDLIATFRNTNTVRKVYEEFINNPICGKPNRGFKAVKRWKEKYVAFMPDYVAQRQELLNWANDTKLSKDRRAVRLAKIRASIPDFEV